MILNCNKMLEVVILKHVSQLVICLEEILNNFNNAQWHPNGFFKELKNIVTHKVRGVYQIVYTIAREICNILNIF